MEFELIHHFECGLPAFVKAVYFDNELNKRLLKMKNISHREVKEIKDGPEKATRLMYIEAASAIPREVRALVGDKLSWNEVSTLDKKTNTVSFEIQPTMKLPLECKGRYEMSAEGSGKVRRVISGDVRVRIPLIGKTVEKFVVNQLVASFEEEEIIVRDYLREIAKA
jgi:hypothetical protein